MKIAPIHNSFEKFSKVIEHKICHTGQHYDDKMSKIFFEDLGLPKPDFYLGVQGGTHAEQTARIMIEFEKVLMEEKPDLIIVVGDVNSTIACSLVATKLHIDVVHVESGLRSFDNEMPEEINRILTDRISKLLFVTEESGMTNLKSEGVAEEKIFFVGNVMIDSLCAQLPKIEKSGILNELGLNVSDFILVTLHRPSNVDSETSLEELVEYLNDLATLKKVVFPIHPRTRNNLDKFNLTKGLSKNVIITDPIGYIDFQALMKNCSLVVTDSGGLQEESTFLGVQCITVRTSTERPVTIDLGTNHLVGTDLKKAFELSRYLLNGNKKEGSIPPLWDGNTADRITKIILEKYS